VHSAVGLDTVLNWQGGASTGKAIFATNYNTYTGANVQWQIATAPDGAIWDYDADNLLVIDNMKLTHYATGCPRLTITTLGTEEVVTWADPDTGAAQLQTADSVLGPWQDVIGAVSPYTNSIAAAPKCYRTRWVAPH